MRYRAVRRAERYLGLAVLASMSSVAGAQETQTSVTVSTGASVETNPYNTVNSGGASIAATASIQPAMRWRGEFSTLELSGLASFRQFTKLYGLEDNYSATANISTRVAERLTVRSNASFSYNQGGFNNFSRPGLLPGGLPADPSNPNPNPLPDPSIIDPTVLGQQIRTTAFDMGVGATAVLNAYSSLSVDVSGRANRFRQPGFGDFNTVTGRASYNYQLSEFTSIGAIGSVSRVDYLGTSVGDALTTSIMGSLDRRLGANWTLNGSAGLAITKIKQLPGLPDVKFNSLTAAITFCNQGERGRFCLSGSRSPEPAAFGNVRVNNSVSADYSYRVTERETVTVSSSYAHTGSGRGLVAALPAVDFVSGAIRYDNQFRNNLSLYAATNFSKFYSSDFPRKANFGVNAGVQYRFGAM